MSIARIKTSKNYLVCVLLSFSDKHLNWSFISATFFLSLKKGKTYFLLDCYIDDWFHSKVSQMLISSWEIFFRVIFFVFEVSEEDILLCWVGKYIHVGGNQRSARCSKEKSQGQFVFFIFTKSGAWKWETGLGWWCRKWRWPPDRRL